MDWRGINFDWNGARAFLVTAEEGSLSAAARALGLSQPTLGRQVTALEESLGISLFERGKRGLELTPSGLELVQHVRAMGDGAASFSLAATGKSAAIEGKVCITASEAFAVFTLPGIVRALREEEPRIAVEIIASNQSSDLKRREADIAIRSYRPTQEGLVAKKIGDIEAYLYASEDYLASIGNPKTPDGFTEATFIGFDRSQLLIDGYRSIGINTSSDNFALISENHLVHWELVRNAAGVGVMPAPIGDAEPGIVRILPDIEPLMTELWLVAHKELKTSRRVRYVFDYLDRAMREAMGLPLLS